MIRLYIIYAANNPNRTSGIKELYVESLNSSGKTIVIKNELIHFRWLVFSELTYPVKGNNIEIVRIFCAHMEIPVERPIHVLFAK